MLIHHLLLRLLLCDGIVVLLSHDVLKILLVDLLLLLVLLIILLLVLDLLVELLRLHVGINHLIDWLWLTSKKSNELLWAVDHHLAVVFDRSWWKHLHILLEVLQGLTLISNDVRVYKCQQFLHKEVVVNQGLYSRILFTEWHNLELIVLVFEIVVVGLYLKSIKYALHDNLVSLDILISELLNKSICLLCLFVKDLNLRII